jgi:hypothetical protein
MTGNMAGNEEKEGSSEGVLAPDRVQGREKGGRGHECRGAEGEGKEGGGCAGGKAETEGLTGGR